MNVVGAVFWKELRGFFNSPLAYIFLVLFLRPGMIVDILYIAGAGGEHLYIEF